MVSETKHLAPWNKACPEARRLNHTPAENMFFKERRGRKRPQYTAHSLEIHLELMSPSQFH